MTAAIATTLACFTFSFGNVLELGLYLDTPVWIAGLVDPALAVTVVGMIFGIRYLTGHGMTAAEIRPIRQLITFAGVTTLLLNVAAAFFARGHADIGAAATAAAQSGSVWWKLGAALYDCIAPLLLLGWAHVGTWFLATHNRFRREAAETRETAARLEREAARAEREALKQARGTDTTGGT